MTVDCGLQPSSLPAKQPYDAAEEGQPVPTLMEVSAVDTPHEATVRGPPSRVALPRSMRTTPRRLAGTAMDAQAIAGIALLCTTLAAGK